MTDKDKRRIARLVAEKVWGWQEERIKLEDPDSILVWVDDKSVLQWDVVHHGIPWAVFSWPGFGRTVESMAAFGWAWGRSGGNTIDGPGSIYWMHREVETPIDCEEKIDDQILDCHLAALDALGIDWRTDND